jgi:pimeloyl-ACP methyl ester carboxylesterase
MDTLGLKQAHIVGHSLSGLIALQLAIDAPERVSSLALIEPALTAFTPSSPQSGQASSKIGALYHSGDKVGALDAFMQGVSGQDYRKMMDRVLPAGWFEQGVKDIDTFFQIDLPAVRAWNFDRSARVKQPVLSIYGIEKRWDDRVASGAEFDQVLHSWFPQTESLAIRGSYHWPHVTNTIEVAKGLVRFCG